MHGKTFPNHLLGYVKKREKQRQPFTTKGKRPVGRLRVMMLFVVGPKDCKYISQSKH